MDKMPLSRTIGMISSQARPNWHTQGLRLFEGHQLRQDSARDPIGLGSSCPGICLPTDFFFLKKKKYDPKDGGDPKERLCLQGVPRAGKAEHLEKH